MSRDGKPVMLPQPEDESFINLCVLRMMVPLALWTARGLAVRKPWTAGELVTEWLAIADEFDRRLDDVRRERLAPVWVRRRGWLERGYEQVRRDYS